MKILVISARYFPESFAITNICETLAKRGHNVTVLTGRPNYGKWKIYDGYKKVKKEVINDVEIHRVKEFPRKKGTVGLLINYISIYFKYKKYLRKTDSTYDIVLSHVISPIFTISYAGRFCRKNDIPHMLYGLDIWPESLVASGYFKKDSLFFKIIKKYCIKIYKTCDLISYSSPSVEQYLLKNLNVNVPFKHIYQPCLTPLPSDTIVNGHHYKENKQLNILFCGTIARFNHLNLFIEAISKSKYKDQIIFTLVGSGSDMENVRNKVAKLKLNNVNFIGRVTPSETIKFYSRADVLFVPLYSNSETSKMIPQKVIEYFMYNRPILGMLKGDGAALIKQASKFNLICDQTIDSLVKGLDYFCDLSNSEFVQCGNENRKFFLNNKRFQLDSVVDEIENSLSKLLITFNKKNKNNL